MKSLMEDYLQIDILDDETMEMLREYTQGSPELITDLIDSFEPESSVLVADIKKALEDKDEALLKSSSHSLSGISGSIGALRLRAVCSDTENSFKSGNTEQAFMIAEIIFPVYEELIAILKTM